MARNENKTKRKSSATRKSIPIVKTTWQEVLEPEYYFSFKCPHCNRTVNECDLDEVIYETEKVNKKFHCPWCDEEFKLIVPEF